MFTSHFTLPESGKKLKSSNVILPASYSIVSNLSNFHKSPNTPRHLRFREVIKKTIGINICVLFITVSPLESPIYKSFSLEVRMSSCGWWLWCYAKDHLDWICFSQLEIMLNVDLVNADLHQQSIFFHLTNSLCILAFLTLHQKTPENSCLMTIFSGPNRNVSFLKIQCVCLSRS